MTDRYKPKLTKPRKNINGFVREDDRVLKWQPLGDRKPPQNAYGKYSEAELEEEEKFFQHHHGGRGGKNQEHDFEGYRPSARGRKGGYRQGRGQARGFVPQEEDYNDPEGYVWRARFQRGRGRGRGANSHQTHDYDRDNSKSFGQPVEFTITKQRSRGRGQRYVPRAFEDEERNDDYYGEEEVDYFYGEEEEEKFTNEGFLPDYRSQLKSYYQDDDEAFEEKYIQDKRSMQSCFDYKDFVRPEFFQGPQYVTYRLLTSQNRKKRIESYELNDIQFQGRLDYQNQDQKHSDKFQRNDNRYKNRKEVYGQDFDFKMEKRIQNQFWTQEDSKVSENNKDFKTSKNKRHSQRKGQHPGKPQANIHSVKKGNNFAPKHGKNFQKKPEQRSRTIYEDYLDEAQIKKGLESGTLFQGILRVNQMNRKRAFVSVDDIKIDVMLEGLNSQNRALDGDTVVIELFEPYRWSSFASNNVVIGKDSLNNQVLVASVAQQKGYTNETAVETRIVDLEVIGEEPVSQDAEELQEVRAAFLKEKTLDKIEEKDNDPDQEEDEAVNESSSDEDAIAQAINEAEAREESKHDSEQEIGYGFMDDDKVSSDEEELKALEKNKSHQQGKVKEAKPLVQVKKIKKLVKFEGKTRTERLEEINRIAKDLRPMGKVKAIVKSPNLEKEHLVTLTAVDNYVLEGKNAQQIFRIYNEKSNAASCGIFAVPVSKKLPWMAIMNVPKELVDDLKAKKKPNQRYYLAKMKQWKSSAIRPACNILQSIGEAGNLDAESLRILKTHDIWSDEYETEGQGISEKIHESLRVFTKDIDPQTGEWVIHPEELKKRLDLRKKRIFTIDPITAKDLDDALSIEKISDFIYEIGVHIADVSYFVQQGTELDKEAQLRCTSVYFVHKVYPMLPRLLCERLCSLNPKVDRLAYSVFFRMDIRTGEVDRREPPRIVRTVIRSCAKWNYQLVQDVLDGKITREDQLPPEYRPQDGVKFADMRDDCFLMNEVAQKRRGKRLDNGSIVLQNREFTFALDQESRLPLGFQESYRIESKFLVEEYMLLANVLVAEHLYQHCKDKTLLRAHPDLEPEKKEKLRLFFEKVGLADVDLTNSKSLSVSLERLREAGDSAKFNVAMRKFLTCLQCAKYMCINDCDPEQYQHYGLNFPLYTHFTSPIRRYADLLVHRLVTLTLQHKDATRELIELMDYSNYAELCSEKSLNAKRASQTCVRLFHCLLLKTEGVKVFETLLFDMDHGSISIYIDEVNMHHKLRLRDDQRIDSVLFFEEELVIVAHVKGKKSDRLDEFKKVQSVAEVQAGFQSEEYIVLRIFDKVRVKVETTTEFPLDIKCTLMFTKEDGQEYDMLFQAQVARYEQKTAAKKVLEMPVEENLNDEV